MTTSDGVTVVFSMKEISLKLTNKEEYDYSIRKPKRRINSHLFLLFP